MEFSFHTIVYEYGQPVYYNVYQMGGNKFHLEVLDNPNNVEAENFDFSFDGDQWIASIQLSEKAEDALGDEIQTRLNQMLK